MLKLKLIAAVTGGVLLLLLLLAVYHLGKSHKVQETQETQITHLTSVMEKWNEHNERMLAMASEIAVQKSTVIDSPAIGVVGLHSAPIPARKPSR